MTHWYDDHPPRPMTRAEWQTLCACLVAAAIMLALLFSLPASHLENGTDTNPSNTTQGATP